MYLPPLLKEKFTSAKWERNTVGMSGASVYKLSGINGGGNAYLKTAHTGGPETLKEEMQKLSWLADKSVIPKVLHFETNGDQDYLLITEIDGENLKESKWGSTNPIEMGQKMAEGLKAIHHIPITECPFFETLPVKIEKARQRIHAGLVDPSDFEPAYSGNTAEQLLSLLETTQPKDEDLVFTHGDFSLANILAKNNQITGFVDWGRAGICDRHQDLGIAIRSLKHHFTEDAVEAFINTYGRQRIDFEKITYYILLDELF